MSADLLGISVSGLKIAQTKLSTVGHNIANAGVDGFSRQRVNVVTNPEALIGGSYQGSGASVASIERVVNQFVIDQLRVDTSLHSGLEAFHSNISLLDGLMADFSTGLSSALETFFAAVQNGADDPTSIPARQLIISESENLSDRFNTLHGRFDIIANGIEEQLASAIEQINALTSSIANLNLKISDALGVSGGASPNDMLDQRDEALRKLSEYLTLQTYNQGNGQINIVVGSGQNLVVGTSSRSIDLVASDEDPSRSDVVFFENTGTQVITDRLSGGTLGGLLDFRDTTLAETYNEFGRIAVVMAESFNTINQSGVNLNNQFGGLFFYDVNDESIAANRVIANSNNAPPQNSQLSLLIREGHELTTSDYEMSMSKGGLFRIERLDDGVIVGSGILPGSFPYKVDFDGLQLVFDGGIYQEGDTFKLQAVKMGARDITSRLVAPAEIAFASPLLTDATLGNRGSGTISQGEVLSLNDLEGKPLPLFSMPGEMNPPLLVQFVSPSIYHILDNSDPGRPVDLVPPIRNQRFVSGIPNNLFSTDPGGTMVVSDGEFVGLPEGRTAATSAALQIVGALAPDFSVTDFSGANQFSFEINVSNTLNGVNDTATPLLVTISGGAITDENMLLQEINAQLSGNDVEAVIVDDGSGTNTSTLAFRLRTAGFGDITLQNYSGPAGPSAADGLLGFTISSGPALTSAGNANGFSGFGLLANGYPGEALTVTRAAENAGVAPQTYDVFTALNATARETASALGNLPGVSANAFTYVELSNFQLSETTPLQFSVNGEDLIEYIDDPLSGNRVISPSVPNPQTAATEFQQYLADRINSNSALAAVGMYALAARDVLSGGLELRIHSNRGDDIEIGLHARSGESVDVGDGVNNSLRLQSTSAAVKGSVVVGGKIDVSLEEGLGLSSFPPVSALFGDTQAEGFAKSTFLGIQASINGITQVGDAFTLDFNLDGASDNRNALNFVDLEDAGTIENGVSSFSGSYGTLVEKVGIETSAVVINRDAADQVLKQSFARRDSISAVNLDEEAADLIRFEQLFSANAQVISVARDLFDRLISSF